MLFNPTDSLEDGTPYIQYTQTLAGVGEAGNSVELVVEFKRDSGIAFDTPDYVVIEVITENEEITEVTDNNTAGESGSAVTRMDVLANGDFMIEFNTVIGNVYAIEYSEDLESWTRVLPLYTANVEKTQWVDNGPPKTISHPSSVSRRLYRIVMITE